MSDYSSVHLKLGEAAAAIAAARRTLSANAELIMQQAQGNGVPTLEEKSAWRRDSAYAALLARRAVDLLFEVSGGAVLFITHPLQRAFRDIHAASSHIALNWDA